MPRRSGKSAGHPRTGITLLVLGVLFLVLAPLSHWVVLPRLERTPAATDTTNVTKATGQYFDGAGMKGTEFTITTHLTGDPDAGAAQGADVWNLSTQVDTPETLALHDPHRSLQWIVERVVFDPHTNEPVHCCGEAPAHEGDAFLKFPFNVEKRTYQYWNPFVHKAFPVGYAGDVELEGHTFYRFTGKVPATVSGGVDMPAAALGQPAQAGTVHLDSVYRDDGVEVLVDPLSGSPVSSVQHAVSTLRLPGSDKDLMTVSNFTVAPSPDDVHASVQQAISGDRALTAIGTTGPIGLAALGFVLAVLGILLRVRAGRDPSRPEKLEPETLS